MDSKSLKAQSIRFARSLQTLIKMVNMFSVDHRSAAPLLHRSYDLLNPLLKQARSLTLGFVEQRVLLNNILTVEEGLKALEYEFLRRGIGAITFEAGLTLAAFRSAVAILAATPKLIEESGGLALFLEQKPLDFVRIFPALKSEARNQDGDTVLDMGSEEYLISKALSSMNSGFSQGMDSFLTRMEAGAIASGAGGDGSGYGEGGGNGAGGAGNGHGSGSTGAASYGGANGSFRSGGSGAPGALVSSGNLMDIQRAVEQKFEAYFRNPEEDPQKAYVELGKMLSSIRPDVVFTNVTAGTDGLAPAAKEDVTAEVFEDTALRWALRRLAAVPSGEDALVVEEQVFRVLVRSLQATQTATRLARKLAEYAKDYALSPETFKRIQDEIRWIGLTPRQKLCELLGIEHFSVAEFRRALDLIKDLIRMRATPDAVALGAQYFAMFDDHLSLRIEEVARIPELLQALSGAQSDFWADAAGRLIRALVCRKVNQLVHLQVANALIALSRIAATYEDFELVQKVGTALEESAAQNGPAHTQCCLTATTRLLQPSAVDRIGEIYLERKGDSGWTRTVAALLRWAGSDALERLFVRLENEQAAAQRLALVRLLGRVGPSALQGARLRLQHPEWYVVRNACKILSDLKDPELLQHIAPALQHEDERVQKQALQAVIESRLPHRSAVIAGALPFLAPGLLEDALCDLMFEADPECLPALERCYSAGMPAAVLARVVNVIATIAHQDGVFLLARIYRTDELPQAVRDAAMQAIEERLAWKSRRSEKQGPDSSEGPAALPRQLRWA